MSLPVAQPSPTFIFVPDRPDATVQRSTTP